MSPAAWYTLSLAATPITLGGPWATLGVVLLVGVVAYLGQSAWIVVCGGEG